MKAIISTTYDDTYLFYLPITTWCWNRLGVDVICFMPSGNDTIKNGRNLLCGVYPDENKRAYLINETVIKNNGSLAIHSFNAPKHKEATYAQCARLYGACLDLPEDEILITSDIDMAVFQNLKTNIDYSISQNGNCMTSFGSDLVPEGQLPICYAWGSVIEWRKAFNEYKIHSARYGPAPESVKSYQQQLDSLLGGIEADHFRGNYWCKDQETLFNKLQKSAHLSIPRARPGTQFALHRVDRDDINWRSYVNDDLIDAHLWRPGYADENFANIMELLQMKYSNEDFTWLVEYQKAYKALL